MTHAREVAEDTLYIGQGCGHPGIGGGTTPGRIDGPVNWQGVQSLPFANSRSGCSMLPP